MLENEPEKPSPEVKTAEETDTSPATTDSNKKRVFLGAIIGGIIFVGLLISIIVLVATSNPTYEPPKPKPKPVIHVGNPFYTDYVHADTRKYIEVTIINKRTELEHNTTQESLAASGELIIKNTTENPEPVTLKVYFKQLDEHLLNVKYTDSEWPRWTPPDPESGKDPYARVIKQVRSPMHVHVSDQPGSPFDWKFNGKAVDLLPLITTENCRLQYFDKYIEFEARLQTDKIFGMGERTESFILRNDNYSLWNRATNYEFGQDSETGTYSSHPFFINKLNHKNDFIGVYMHNSNAMLFSFWHTLNNGTFINYKMIGGIIDLYIFHEAEPEYIIRRYHQLIGRPYLPPLWAMGLQQGRRGYTVEKMKAVYAKYRENYLPLDAFWADIDINEKYKTFTVDQTAFAGIKDFVQSLHKENVSFVAVATPHIKVEAGYKYYDEAMKKTCLVMSASEHEKPYEGRTIAGTTVWLDFFTQEASLIWAEGIHDFRELTGLDGIWITGNEVSNMYEGLDHVVTSADEDETAQKEGERIPNPFHNASEFDYIPYRPTLDPLERNTLPMSAYHAGDMAYHKEYYTHNLYGLQVTKATYNALYGIFEDKRFLVASRSTWPGSGQYGGHWLGTNYATWESMRASIPGMLNFNMFGIPHVGAAIGGVIGNAEPELLVRWYELGAFSPLMLSYTGINTNDKEPYFNSTLTPYIHDVIMERYSLIHFMYTEMFEAFAWGGPVVHPLFFDFPDDDIAYKPEVADRTFMWARTLYVIPALIKGQNRVKAYLPNWRWYDLRNLEMVVDYHLGGVGDYYIFDQPLGKITVLIKGGTIVPYQHMTRAISVKNTDDLKKIASLLIVAPDHTGRATGTLVIDAEGIRPHPDPSSQTYRHYAFSYMNQIFRINKLAGYDFYETHTLDYFMEVIILDVFGEKAVTFACMMDTNYNKHELVPWKAEGRSTLIIHDVDNKLLPMFTLESIMWGTAEDHDFCRFQVYAETAQYTDDKTLQAELVSSDPTSRQVKLDLKAMLLTDRIVSLTITRNYGGSIQPWIVPGVVDEEVRRVSKATTSIQDSGFNIAPLHQVFYFELADPVDSRNFLFTTKNFPFVFLDNYIHMKFMVNSRHIFGLGERVHKFELTDGIYSMFNADQMFEETGFPPGNNMYGSHPFYLVQLHNPQEFAAVFILNSCPMDFKIRHVGMQMQIDHMLIGGSIDAFFFQKGKVDEVIKNYQYVIGKPEPLPYWAFGYHQSRWGYGDSTRLKYVISQFRDHHLPLDAIWLDKDYMEEYKVFTYDKKKWGDLHEIVKGLHDNHTHFVSIVDPGIAVEEGYRVYSDGLERGIYIKSNATQQPLQGITWPGYSVWVDFVNPAALRFWEDELQRFHDTIPFDGLWLDMNEPSNFCDGECPDEKNYIYYHFPLDFYDDLYYNPTHRGLERETISMEALHYGGGRYDTEFYYHNLYGLMQSKATAAFFVNNLRKRPFIISSSTFPGIGRYASHWLGDNHSSWHMMEYSISGMLSFQLFGIPFVGADICGYEGNATISLCSRWMQLGAFYPFMRNHNSPSGHPQEPYVDAKLEDVSRKAILARYSLVRYFYSDYMHVVLEGGMTIKPLLFLFPADKMTYDIIDTTFMFGYALRFTPVLTDNTGSITSYFPNHDWFEFETYRQVVTYNATATTGQNVTMPCSLDTGKLNLHIMGGSIFPYQADALNGAPNVLTMLNYSVRLVVAPDHHGQAKGVLVYDNDESLSIREKNFYDFHLTLNNSAITFKMESGSTSYKYPHSDNVISSIHILGKHYPNTVCAKVVEHGRTMKLKISKNENAIVLEPETNDYKILAENVASIVWSDNNNC